MWYCLCMNELVLYVVFTILVAYLGSMLFNTFSGQGMYMFKYDSYLFGIVFMSPRGFLLSLSCNYGISRFYSTYVVFLRVYRISSTKHMKTTHEDWCAKLSFDSQHFQKHFSWYWKYFTSTIGITTLACTCKYK